MVIRYVNIFNMATISSNAWCTVCALALSFRAGNALAANDAANSATFPAKPVRCIVPFAPGGGADGIGRLIQPAVSSALGQSFVLDNRPGASGVVGSQIAAQSSPDGYTVLLITTTHTVNLALMSKLPYATVRDFMPVSLLASQPNILVVNAATPVRSVAELVALAKAKAGALTYASGGNGSSPHLSGELFSIVAGVKMTHVPYKSAGPGIVDLLGGHVDLIFAGPIDLITHVKSGRLRALAVADTQRSPVLPDVPTMAEAGQKGVETGTWYGVLAPARTEASVIAALHNAFAKAIRSPETTTRLLEFGVTPIGQGPAQFGPFIRAEIVKWSRVVQDAKLTGS